MASCLYNIKICLCVISYDMVLALAWEFWFELVGDPLDLAPNKKINLDWSVMGQVTQIKRTVTCV